MSKADVIYNQGIKEILTNGQWDHGTNVRTRWADGTPAYTKSILDFQMKFDNGEEIPILTTKRVPRKDPITEMFWIWRDKSNDVFKLREMGCTVWDEWQREDGTIGKAYGWQLRNKKRKVKTTQKLVEMFVNKELNNVEFSYVDGHAYLDQVDYLLYTLKTNPSSRRIKTTLWCVEDLDDMALEPCVYETHWQVWGGKLNLTVNIRSNDSALGNSYNIYQYSVLHRLIAQVSNLPVGTICFNIDNFHYYDRHEETLLQQIKGEQHEAPTLRINSDIKSFYDFTIDDLELINYKHSGSFKYEVAI